MLMWRFYIWLTSRKIMRFDAVRRWFLVGISQSLWLCWYWNITKPTFVKYYSECCQIGVKNLRGDHLNNIIFRIKWQGQGIITRFKFRPNVISTLFLIRKINILKFHFLSYWNTLQFNTFFKGKAIKSFLLLMRKKVSPLPSFLVLSHTL